MPSERRDYYCDTTIVYFRLHSHPLLKQEVGRRRDKGRFTLSNFVRGEYIRGYVVGLLELYFAIKAEQEVEAGIHVFTSDQAIRPRRLVNAFNSAAYWLCGFEDWKDPDKTCRRLGEYIRKLLMDFDHEFGHRVLDPTKCEFGLLSFPSESYSEDALLDFYDQCQTIREKPACDQCEFRRKKLVELNSAAIDLHSDSQRKRFKAFPGYVNQAKWIDKAVNTERTDPSCWYCDRLGDTIIALSAPKSYTILTGDSKCFPAFGEILEVPVELVPSLKELRKS